VGQVCVYHSAVSASIARAAAAAAVDAEKHVMNYDDVDNV